MADNPWKKQADTNKGVPGVAPKGPPATGGVPPWMKNKAEQPQPPAQSSQPVSQPQQPQPPVPVANKPPTTGPPATGTMPPWMAKSPAGQPVPPTIKPAQTPGTQPAGTGAPTGGVPPWMKNKQATSPIGTDRKVEDQKAKEEEEARAREKEEEERRRKEEEVKREARERKRMEYEEEYSKIREQEDSKKKPQKSSKKSPKKQQGKPQSSLSPKKPLGIRTAFHKYLHFLSLSCSRQQQYSSKLQHQKQYIETLYRNSQEVKKNISEYLGERKIVQRKKNVINLENLVLEYALVEGVSEFGGGGVYFKVKSVEVLEGKFGLYQLLYTTILKLIRKSSVFRLRVPLLCRASYKGIEFLCESVCDQLLDAVLSPVENFVELQGELMQLEKELREIGYEHINRKVLAVKKVTMNSDEYYILYLIQNIDSLLTPEPPKPHPQTPLPQSTKLPLSLSHNSPTPIPHLTNLSLLATHKLSLSYSFMRSFAEIKKNQTLALQQSYLNLFQVAHAIRVVYASCQGEVEEEAFWGLLFQGNGEVWGMVARAYEGMYGGEKVGELCQLRNRFMLAKILQSMLPITFHTGKQRLASPQKSPISTPPQKKPQYLQNTLQTIPYPLDSFQLYQISQLFDKTIENPNKLKISEDAQNLQHELCIISEELYVRRVVEVGNRARLAFERGVQSGDGELIRDAVQGVEGYLFDKGREMDRIIIYPLLMKFYITILQLQLQIPPKQKQPSNQKPEPSKQASNRSEASNRFQKSKLQQSQVKQIYFSSNDRRKQKEEQDENSQRGSQKEREREREREREKEEDYQIKLIKTFKLLLEYIEELFEDQKEVWIHAGLYMVLASYYSKSKGVRTRAVEQESSSPKVQQDRKLSYFNKPATTIKQKVFSKSQTQALESPEHQKSSKNLQNASQSMVQQSQQPQPQEQPGKKPHPYRKQCLKFLQLSHRLCLQFHGSHSPEMASFLHNESQIYYNIHQLQKCQQSLEQALKIYKSSSKNNRNIMFCNVVLGKCMVERGREAQDERLIEKGVQMLEDTAEELFGVGLDVQVMQVYEFLCANLQFGNGKVGKTKATGDSETHVTSRSANKAMSTSGDGLRYIKIQHYLQKMAEMSFSSKNIEFLKKVIKKVIKNQISFYSKERAIVLKDLHQRYLRQNIPEEEDDRQKMERELENMEYLQENKDNFGGLLELIKWSFGILKVKGESLELRKATETMEIVLGFFTERQILQMLAL